MQRNSGIQDIKLKRATEILDAIETRLSKGWLETTNEMTLQNAPAYEQERRMRRANEATEFFD